MIRPIQTLALFAMVVAIGQSVIAQTSTIITPSFYIRKQVNYVQTGPNEVAARDAHVWVIMDPNSRYTLGVPFSAKMEIAGTTYPLSIETRNFISLAFDKAYGSLAELEAAFPAYESAKITVTWPGGQHVTLPQVPITTAPAAPLTNFDALQNWNGGPITLFWKLPALTSFFFGPNFPAFSDGVFSLQIYRASSIDATDKTVLRRVEVVLTNDLTVNLDAAPGETLYGEFIPQFTAQVGRIWFTMRRAPLVSAPTIDIQPASKSVLSGTSATLSVNASGTGLSFQWRKNGNVIPGATNATLDFASIQPADAGVYTVVVSNSAGQITSEGATITVITPPNIVIPPVAQSVMAGANAMLSVTTTGTAPLTFQWLRNGTAIAGATQATYTLERARPTDSGQYSVIVTNSVGTMTSSAAELKVNRVSRIANLSILTSLASASDNFTLGFVLGGPPVSAAATKPVLVRAVGPSLVPLGVSGALDDPKLELYAGQTLATANDNWGGDATLAGSFTAVGAFAFANAASRDAAATARVATSSNSIKIFGSGSGLVLAELYDATTADDFGVASPRFANVSVLKQIGSGLTAGFVIDGSEPLRVLVRAVGPALGAFGVTGTVADPKLDLFQSGSAAAIASNDNWGAATNATQVAAAAASVGAFTLAPESRDAVLLVTLAPGSYTAQVSGVANTTGIALVEVYEVQ